ncbi:WD40 repeat domain-containing protein [Candidatus Babeliales bacterium]|nr:WD40 repeat domain-containing protein [Candidatus Babeliales bacterium]
MKNLLLSFLLSTITTLSAVPTLEQLALQKQAANYRSESELNKALRDPKYFADINKLGLVQDLIVEKDPIYLQKPLQRRQKWDVSHNDDKKLFLTTEEGYNTIWRLVDGYLEPTRLPIQGAYRLHPNHNGTSFITQHYSNESAYVWRLVNNRWRQTSIKKRGRTIHSIHWSPNKDEFVITYSVNAETFEGFIWQLVDGRWKSVAQPIPNIFDVKWNPNGNSFVAIQINFQGILWVLGDGEWQASQLELENASKILWSPNGEAFLSKHYDETAILWVLLNEQYQRGLLLQNVSNIYWNPNPSDKSFIIILTDGSTYLWQEINGQWIATQLKIQDVITISWCPSGKYFISKHADESINIWKSVGGQWEPTLLPTQDIFNIFWNKEHSFITKHKGSESYLWQLRSGEWSPTQIKIPLKTFEISWDRMEKSFLSKQTDGTTSLWYVDLTLNQCILIRVLDMLHAQEPSQTINFQQHAHLYEILCNFPRRNKNLADRRI